jgi:hypothetical protein
MFWRVAAEFDRKGSSAEADRLEVRLARNAGAGHAARGKGLPRPARLSTEPAQLLAGSRFPNLPPPHSAEPGRQSNLQALRAGTSESRVVRKNDVAAALADHPPVGKNGHWVERPGDDTVGTTRFFLRHCRWPPITWVGHVGTIRPFVPIECSTSNGVTSGCPAVAVFGGRAPLSAVIRFIPGLLTQYLINFDQYCAWDAAYDVSQPTSRG